jgi:hypothetical protein
MGENSPNLVTLLMQLPPNFSGKQIFVRDVLELKKANCSFIVVNNGAAGYPCFSEPTNHGSLRAGGVGGYFFH